MCGVSVRMDRPVHGHACTSASMYVGSERYCCASILARAIQYLSSCRLAHSETCGAAGPDSGSMLPASVLPRPPSTRVCIELSDEQAARLVQCTWGTFAGSLAGPDGRGCQHWKKPKGHHQAVRQLASEGADLSADLNGYGGTALHKACEEGDLELARILVVGGANLSARAKIASRFEGGTAQTWTPLHFAVKKGTVGIVDLLLGAGAPMGMETSAPSPYDIVMTKGGKGAHKLRNAFSRVQRLVARRQTLSWTTAMHARLGKGSPVALLSPDLCSLVATLIPSNADVATTDRARAPDLVLGATAAWERRPRHLEAKSRTSAAAIQSESF